MRKLLLALLLSLAITGCTVGDETAHRVLTDEGYTDIQMEGYAFFGCSDSDTFQSNFRAKRGDRVVLGTICCGWWKDCTVRH